MIDLVEPRIIPIRIRPDLVVLVQDIPHDLTSKEAQKIASVVKAMVKK